MKSAFFMCVFALGEAVEKVCVQKFYVQGLTLYTPLST